LGESETVRTCIVCGGRDYLTVCSTQEIADQRAYLAQFHRARLRPSASPDALADKSDFTQDDNADIVACAGCGLLRRHVRPKPGEVIGEYTEDTYGRERLDALFESQVSFFRPLARRLAARLPEGATVVEVGSFVGGFLAAGSELGWNVLGVDPGREVGEYCREHGLTVHAGTLADAPIAPRSVDCVAVWNTFDQLPDPRPTLEAASALVRPEGILAIRVPNGQCYQDGMALLRRLRRSHLGALADPLLRAMAWNNLLSFPYLLGYSTTTLDTLLKQYRLRRIGAAGDTLCRLSDAQTRTWARWEEAGLKGLIHVMSGLERGLASGRTRTAPWLNAYYRPMPPMPIGMAPSL
jgi:SAM-dependent methyltransferase